MIRFADNLPGAIRRFARSIISEAKMHRDIKSIADYDA